MPAEFEKNMSPSKEDFLNLRYRYRGKFLPTHVVFNANLQEFAQQVSCICNLQTAGKLPPEDAYCKLARLWQQLQNSHDNLEIGPLDATTDGP